MAEELLDLCHVLGEPHRDLVLVSEGNVSMRLPEDRMLIKASGCALETMTADDLVVVDRRIVLTLLEQAHPSDEATAHTYGASVVSGRGTPSVEAVLHAVIYRETDATVIAHTHPVAVNSILCSTAPDLLVAGALFPDQIVVLGRHQLLVPYTDPGVPLAAAVATHLRAFIAEHGESPRVIYLINHGLFVLADSTTEAVRVTSMAVKVARVLLGTLAAGGPAFLPPEQVDRIEGRPDEKYRRSIITQVREGT